MCKCFYPPYRLLAADFWKQVGTQWEKENEDGIKDKLDFLLTPPLHYPEGGQSVENIILLSSCFVFSPLIQLILLSTKNNFPYIDIKRNKSLSFRYVFYS